LGILDEPVFDENQLSLAPGECLLLYSDGVTDAIDHKGNFFNLDGLKMAMKATAGRSAQETCQSILYAVDEFRGNCPQSDDITLMAIHRSHSS
jgi:phosphoserine phosphatase RsbU/P